MGRRGGSADLPLHGGRVPRWLADRMAALGRVICEAIVLHYGREALLARLAHPFWFQSFGAVMGMDWHSSGITTSVLGALKRGLEPVADELGLYVCGGRGRHSRATPAELLAVGARTGLDGEALARASRLVAKVDSAAVQDGYELYLHGFLVAADGRWVVVQQGMNGDAGWARRYHWCSEGLRSFVDTPHAAIDGRPGGEILNLADARASRARTAQLSLLAEGPERVLGVLRGSPAQTSLPLGSPSPGSPTGPLPHLSLPAHHEVRPTDVVLRRVHGALAAAESAAPADFESLLLVPGVGRRTLWALSMVAEVVHGAPSRFSDPARFSLAHGGKDGHPYPVPLEVYDQTLHVLRDAVRGAKLGREEEAAALARLDAESRRLEPLVDGPSLPELIRHERTASWRYGGRTVFGDARPPGPAARVSPGASSAPARAPGARRRRSRQLALGLE
jgi:hypothetical protein